ncbi:hypothetical protein EYC84_010833 [Monilinia fructicola]|uniref:Uncharacterized protein n=1 Tax=Monilinia fructicola TaxID=38448 RepID=A0A5M9JBN7_MONFR|nr:hypothetical protein EYC84_010833 [Monilinia fructicola]
MGRSKKPSGPNANLEPLGGFLVLNFADEKSNPIHVEQDTKDLSLSPFRTSTHQSTAPPVLRPEAHNTRVTIIRAPQDFIDLATAQEAHPANAPALVRPEFQPRDPTGLDLLTGSRHAIGVWQIVITTGHQSWAELASRKHREWTAPAPGSPTSPTLPDPVEESWWRWLVVSTRNSR